MPEIHEDRLYVDVYDIIVYYTRSEIKRFCIICRFSLKDQAMALFIALFIDFCGISSEF